MRDDAIPLHVRQTAVKNLSASLDVCEGGTLSNLIATQRSLLMAAGGIKARFWKMKEDCTRGILQDAVCRKLASAKAIPIMRSTMSTPPGIIWPTRSAWSRWPIRARRPCWRRNSIS